MQAATRPRCSRAFGDGAEAALVASVGSREPSCVSALDLIFWSTGVLSGVGLALLGGPEWMWAALVGTHGSTMVSHRLAWRVACWVGWVRPSDVPDVL